MKLLLTVIIWRMSSRLNFNIKDEDHAHPCIIEDCNSRQTKDGILDLVYVKKLTLINPKAPSKILNENGKNTGIPSFQRIR